MKPPRAFSIRPPVIVALLTFASQGCLFFPTGTGAYGYGQQSQQEAMKSAEERTDEITVSKLERARKNAKQNPGGVDEARVFAQTLSGAFQLGTVKRKGLNGETLLAEATDALEASVIAFPDQKAEAMFSKGAMLLAAEKTEEGLSALHASMDARPTPRACVALIVELDKKGDPEKEILPLCKKTIPTVTDDETRYALLDACWTHTHTKSDKDGLKWAGEDNVAFYKEYSMKLAVEAQERRREEEEREAQRRAEMDARRQEEERRMAESRAAQASAPAAPTRWSLTLRNNCDKTVKLFLGKKPKWGSGTYTSLGSHTISSYSGSPGDMIWLVDDGQNGLSSLSPSGSQRMQILQGCTGFGPD